MATNKMLAWEDVPHTSGSKMYRVAIFGGWLVHMVSDVRSPMYTGYDQPEYKEDYEWRTSITFVPDPKHEWDLKEDYSIRK